MPTKSTFEKIVSFLQGASWALVFLISLLFFKFFLNFGIFFSIIMAFFGAMIGMVFVVIFEIAHIQQEKLKEAKQQTQILEKIYEKLSDNRS